MVSVNLNNQFVAIKKKNYNGPMKFKKLKKANDVFRNKSEPIIYWKNYVLVIKLKKL